MLKPLLTLILLLGLNTVCPAQKESPAPASVKPGTFIADDRFSESDLQGYVYAFSTADSSLGIGDMRSRATPFRLVEREIPHFGSNSRYHWIRTDVKNAGLQSRQLVSYLHFNELTDVCFYVVNNSGRVVYRQEHLNQRTYFNRKPIPSRFFAFPVDLSAGEQVTVYWRVYSEANSVVAPIRLYTRDAFNSFLRIYDSFAFLCLGVIISAFLLSLFLFFVTRLKVLFFYAGYCLFYFFLCIINDGMVLQYFHIDPFEIAIGSRLVATGLMLFFLLQFSKHFLNAPALLGRPVVLVTDVLSGALLILGITIAVFSLNAWISVLFLMGAMALILIFVMMAAGMLQKKHEAFAYFIAVGPFFLSSLWFVLISIFYVPATWFYYMSLIVIPIIEMVVLGIELGNKLIRERDKYFEGLHSLERELTSSILRTQESERRRIAADLHDDLGGTLATIRIKFATLKRNLSLTAESGRPALEVMEDIEPLIHKSSNDLRRISQTLMPPEFDRVGLTGSVQHAVDTMPGHTVRFTFLTAGGQRSLPAEKELAIYRIATETLQNIARRPLVHRGSVQIFYCSDRIQVFVEADEKIGSLQEAEKTMRKDLSSSSLLATHLGGTFILEISHSGTLVVADVPY